jgi:hypothetical protein
MLTAKRGRSLVAACGEAGAGVFLTAKLGEKKREKERGEGEKEKTALSHSLSFSFRFRFSLLPFLRQKMRRNFFFHSFFPFHVPDT